jgi:hypothetical protein
MVADEKVLPELATVPLNPPSVSTGEPESGHCRYRGS